MSLTKAKIKAVAALADPKESALAGRVLVEGPRLALEALRRGVLAELFVAEEARERDVLLKAAEEARVPAVLVRPDELARMTEVRTPAGAVGVARRVAESTLGSLCADHDVVTILEGVQDPGNVGTIVRTAVALGAPAVVACDGTADLGGPKALRASAGALLDAPRARAVDAKEAVAAARAAGLRVYVGVARGGLDPSTTPSARRRALVVSNEGGGTRLDADAPDVVRLTIPLADRAESLNVAAAAAILLERLRANAASGRP